MAGINKRILITGAHGFIGKNLVEQLGSKYSVLAPSRQELDLLSESQVTKYFESHQIDIVIHAAVVGGSRIEEQTKNALNQNMHMFFNLMKQEKHFKRMIFLGSGAEYDKSRPLKRIRERDFGTHIPQDEYGFAKFLCSKYIESAKKITCLRIFGIFGKYEDYRYRFISNAICKQIQGENITLNQNVYFDYIYVNDFVRIVDHFILRKPTHTFFNIGTGNKVDLLTLAKEINSIAKKKTKIVVKKSGLNNEYSCDITLLKKEIPYFRFTNRRKAIIQLYNWYAKQPNINL